MPFWNDFVDFAKKTNPIYQGYQLLTGNNAGKSTAASAPELDTVSGTAKPVVTNGANYYMNAANNQGLDAVTHVAPTINPAKPNTSNAAGNANQGTSVKKVTQSYTVNAGNQPYIDQLNALYDQIVNRKPFRYDLNGDLLYRQMADQYTQLGKQAARDATGIASGLTGGYGNSYANMVGNQAYQQHLTALNNQIPSLYDKALNAWLAQGDDLMGKYQLAAQHPGTIEALKPRTYSTTVEVPDETQDATNGIVKGYVLPTVASTTYQQKPLYSYEDMLKYNKLLEK